MASDVTGKLADGVVKARHIAADAAIPRTAMEQRVLGSCAIPPTAWRVHDALHTNLPGTPASDDLGLITGSFAAGADPGPYLSSGDQKANGAVTTRRATCFVTLPDDYEAQATVVIRVTASMETNPADVSATVDVEAFRLDSEDGSLGAADLCATAAQDMNDTDTAAFDFTLTGTTLLAGDVLLVRLSLAVRDNATVTAVTAAIHKVEVLSDRR